jgi:hypothetical protein
MYNISYPILFYPTTLTPPIMIAANVIIVIIIINIIDDDGLSTLPVLVDPPAASTLSIKLLALPSFGEGVGCGVGSDVGLSVG